MTTMTNLLHHSFAANTSTIIQQRSVAFRQLAGFRLVGLLNTIFDLLALNLLLWTFAKRMTPRHVTAPSPAALQTVVVQREQRMAVSLALARHGLSVVLPAYNEEAVIAVTLATVVSTLDEWGADFEVIVVNDGSTDRTAAIVNALTQREARVRQIAHATNQGYGAALADGFAAATKDLTCFMDADGQFAIRDLARLLPHIDRVDAVLGFRQHRQDSWMRRCNAWGWNALVALALGVRVRDLDCAFKLFRTEFLHAHPPQTRGALINAELLFTLTRTGATFQQIGVRHLPRQGGHATGANPRVIVRALHDLARYAWEQRLRRTGRGR